MVHHPLAAIAIAGGGLLFANAVNAAPEFLGGMLGAFIATFMRNDKAKLKVIVEEAIVKHQTVCPYGNRKDN